MIGDVIGNYEIVEQIGRGGMGVVYLGQHTLLGRRAAIKVLLPMHSARPEIVNRFFNEARAVTSISDPGIVQIFDFGYHRDGRAFIVMELLDGDAMDKRLRKAGRLGVVEVLRLGRMICTSLGAAHAAGVIHRDLKPENIFIVRDPAVVGGERAKVLDFGIAKLASDEGGVHRTRTGALMGTPMYMSPEQCRGAGEVDHRSDIYAIGCVMFAMLTGRPPFSGDGTGELIVAHLQQEAPLASSRVPGLSAAVDQIVQRCLAKTPGERFQTMTELVWALDAAEVELANEPGRASRAVPALRTPPTPMPVVPTPYAPPSVAVQTPVAMPTAASVYPMPAGATAASASPLPAPPMQAMPTTLSTAFGETSPPRPRPPARSRGWLAVLAIGALGVGGAIAIGAAMGKNARSRVPAAAPQAEPAQVATPDTSVNAGGGPSDAAALATQPASTPATVTHAPATPTTVTRPPATPTTVTRPPATPMTVTRPPATPTHAPTTPTPSAKTVKRPPPPAPIRGDHAQPTAPPVPFDRGD